MWCANGRIKGKSSWNVHVVSKVRSAIARNRDWGRCNFAKRKNVKYTRAIGLERSAARSEKSGEKIAGRTRSCDIVTSWLPRCLAASQPALRRRTYTNACGISVLSVYMRTNTRAVRYPAATLRRPFALVARLFGGSASYRLRRARFPPRRPSLPHRYDPPLFSQLRFLSAIPLSPYFSRPFRTISNDVLATSKSLFKEWQSSIFSNSTLFSAPLKSLNWIYYIVALLYKYVSRIISPYKDVVIDRWRNCSGSRRLVTSNSVHSLSIFRNIALN